jgi:putative SOS response-associated peptidase YedK
MPVVLAPETWSTWLAATSDHKALLKAFPAGDMEASPIGKAVGSVKNDGTELIERLKA